MNQNTIERLKAAAPNIEKFRNLHPDEQQWLEPMLSQTMRTALAVIEAISSTALTYQEIADECELHVNSVKQILSALNEGGCRIDLRDKTAFAPTGRPRNLARK